MVCLDVKGMPKVVYKYSLHMFFYPSTYTVACIYNIVYIQGICIDMHMGALQYINSHFDCETFGE
jgi:hypothetical protein